MESPPSRKGLFGWARRIAWDLFRSRSYENEQIALEESNRQKRQKKYQDYYHTLVKETMDQERKQGERILPTVDYEKINTAKFFHDTIEQYGYCDVSTLASAVTDIDMASAKKLYEFMIRKNIINIDNNSGAMSIDEAQYQKYF